MARRKRTESDPAHCLTPRQIEILTVIRGYRRSEGCSPTLQEIADEFGISKITVFEHVGTLLDKGMLRRRSNKARSLELTSSVRLPDERPTLLPMVGHIAAGYPIEAIEIPDAVDLEEVFTSRYPVRTLTVDGEVQPYFQQLFWAGLITGPYLPSTVFPAGLSSTGLPIGVQAVGAEYRDYATIDFTRLLAREIGGFRAPPGFGD